MPIGLSVSGLTAIVAAILTIVSTILCLWLPKKRTAEIATGVYLSLACLLSVLIYTSGGLSSPFISAWLAIALFAGFFGSLVPAVLGIAAIALIISSHLGQPIEIPMIITYAIFAILPLVLSFILWHREPRKKKNDTFADLANRLSSVEGKSDVVINSIEDGVMSVNRSGIIDLINPAAETLLGWTSGDALGLDWRSVFKLVNIEGREVAEAEHPVAKALHTNQQTHSDRFQIVTASDRKRLASIVSSPIGHGDGGVIIVFRDITKEKKEEREQAEFISTASHEMRTPVASIEGYLGLALNPATAQIDDKARDYINKAHQSARHLGELFQNLLDISRSEDGRLNSTPEVIDLTVMIGDIAEGLAPLAAEKSLRFIFKPGTESDYTDRRLSPVFYAYVDPHHLREVVSNLIENAIKYTLKGDVIVDVGGDDKIVTISIQDSGIGIPTEDLPHLFQKFYRVDNTDTREIGGTGLGLYLCRRLAESMGGALRVESKYTEGSTFFLDIPRLPHEEAMAKLSDVSTEPDIIPESSRPHLDPQPTAPTPPSPLVMNSSQSTLEFKIPAEFENLPFQDMTLADIETAVANHPVFEDSGIQPLNILPDPNPAPAPSSSLDPQQSVAPQPAAAATYSAPVAPAPPSQLPTAPPPYTSRQMSVSAPERSE